MIDDIVKFLFFLVFLTCACGRDSSKMAIVIREGVTMIQKSTVSGKDSLFLTKTLSGKVYEKYTLRENEKFNFGVRYDTLSAFDSTRYILIGDSIIYSSIHKSEDFNTKLVGRPYILSTDYLSDLYCPGAEYDCLFTPVSFEDSIRLKLSISNWDKSFSTTLDTLVPALEQLKIRGRLPMSNMDTVELDVVLLSQLTGGIIENDNLLIVHYLDDCE